MSKDITIEATSLSKTYKLFDSKRDFLKEAFHPLRKRYHRKFNAIKNISFSVRKGEVVGIIGRNGSGKSTVLKILASIVTPTSGTYQTKGKVAALLELSGGFNKDLSGIENIKFLGALQGYSKEEMEIRMKDIFDFAEIDEYIYQPVKTYSSGMYMRLAFSLSVNVDPDVLIVDEVLAVGDIRFRKKCQARIKEFKDEGKTIVICTHDLNTVEDFCSRAIWMHKGTLMLDGEPKEVVEKYNDFMDSRKP